MCSQLVMSHGMRRLLSYHSSVGPRTVTPPAAQVAGDTPAVEQSPPAPDGPRPDVSGNTLQLDLADNTVDRNQMITSSNRKHGRPARRKMITSFNGLVLEKKNRSKRVAEHGTHDDPIHSYSLHGTVTLAGASQDSKAEENGSITSFNGLVLEEKNISKRVDEHGARHVPIPSYSLHETVTLAGASQDSNVEENGSTRPKRKRKPNRRFHPATWEL